MEQMVVSSLYFVSKIRTKRTVVLETRNTKLGDLQCHPQSSFDAGH